MGRLDPELRAVLRMGIFEVWRLGVPAPVATDSMIRLTRRLGKTSAAGMVNAVMRRAAAADDGNDASPDLTWSHPEWLWCRWSDVFGAAPAEGAMAAAQEPAPPWVWFSSDDAKADVVETGAILERHPWCPGTWTATEGRSELMRAVHRGRAIVQDPSSQLVARLSVSVVDGGGTAVDLCAAPGGKSAMIERLGRWRLFVVADRSPAKVVRLGRRLGDVPVLVTDALRPALAVGAWDLVLLDAPCSGTGTLRRHPELKWRLRPEAIVEAAANQRPMIEAALELLAPGGVLVYATCSVESEENEGHFDTVPAGYETVVMDELLPADLPWTETSAGGVRILPHEHGDGFTVHALRREN